MWSKVGHPQENNQPICQERQGLTTRASPKPPRSFEPGLWVGGDGRDELADMLIGIQ